MSDIKPEVRELADKIKAQFAIDKKTGIGTPVEKLYEAVLPENVTEEQVVRIRNHDTNFVAATNLAFGEESIPVLKKNKEIDSTNIHVDMLGKSHVAVEFNRKQSFPNMKEKGGDPIVKYGTVSIEVHHAAGHNAGELKKVKNFLKEEAEKALS